MAAGEVQYEAGYTRHMYEINHVSECTIDVWIFGIAPPDICVCGARLVTMTHIARGRDSPCIVTG